MSVMPDHWIKERALKDGMISPFVDHKEGTGVLSYGLSSYGYDARLDNKFKIFANTHSVVVDPKNFSQDSFVDREGDFCIIPPNSFVLAKTVEYFNIPRDVMVVCVGKSTYARCGIVVNVTPLEPGWSGYVTLEFSNTSPLPVKVYAFEGACQFLFFSGKERCSKSYDEAGGKYMGQSDVTLPIIS
ncbi:Deoxycytidine triphosphate deaminase [Anaplasma phagocytophilum str. MRK]|uniref:dCTP deaminase n=1 Tax=Anaplasma phagocytophilum TaxID=948 RepID=UPI000533B548|nr:dCTP deaminase [Anaplasma phagocytophilum]KDB56491.1 Deoxycytidine triphosphate deaminase [Anaplasma phagocytophilum str. MRK]